MYSFSGPTTLPEFELGPPSTSDSLQRELNSDSSWETRRFRKHRRLDDEGCSAKKRRLMPETEVDILVNTCPTLSAQQVPLPPPPQPCSAHQSLTLLQPSSVQPRAEMEIPCMEIEAAHRKLQEIEDRIILEDDDEDLDVEPVPRRPVLVISDSLKEGLQRGISDILPQTVAQSVSPSGMELVLWRPPEDPFCQRLKDSLQKQRKQQTVGRQHPTPCSSPSPPLSPSCPPAETCAPMYSFPVLHHSGEEDMEI
ncbi:coiled-coil domain-containing protein 117 isoform X1 [Xiphophorus couchianus]|uniref:coiled-coil domain-containing protein 117 isoform X1 n=1 Tax=Xiphophorus couchianus TaxID=32473 RepID=UPI0010163019|nr:coiled-coil domain-containing protein 117 isoform X1 [Xiphophorus couchianus]XP_027889842.1 coiled-coil domain-containing protein 117 isoform X1 [Xiphophorus couchianus]